MRELKIGRTATTLHKDGDDLVCIYHSTQVVRFSDQSIRLDHGGHRTRTTARRMNEVSELHSLGFGVFQRRGEWYICQYVNDCFDPSLCYPYSDNVIVIDRRSWSVRDANGAIIEAVTIK